jgi:hypothetical protein
MLGGDFLMVIFSIFFVSVRTAVCLRLCCFMFASSPPAQ